MYKRIMFDWPLNLALSGLPSEENCVELVKKFYERGLQVLTADDNDDDFDDLILQSVFRIWYGVLLMRSTLDEPKAIMLLERALTDFKMVKLNRKLAYIIGIAEFELMMRYMRIARRARQLGKVEEAKEFAVRLSILAKASDVLRTGGYINLLLASVKQFEDGGEISQQLIRSTVATAMERLTNTSREGWSNLSLVLMVSGDSNNAIACTFFLRQFQEMVESRQASLTNRVEEPSVPKLDKLESEASSHTKDTRSTKEFAETNDTKISGIAKTAPAKTYVWCVCDGCFTEIDTRSLMYRCNMCLVVDICSTCHKALLEGNLKRNICDKSHGFICVPPVSQPLSDGKIKVNEEEIPIESWLEDLKRQWNL